MGHLYDYEVSQFYRGNRSVILHVRQVRDNFCRVVYRLNFVQFDDDGFSL